MNIEQACRPVGREQGIENYEMGIMGKFDLDKRVIEFSVLIIEIVKEMPKTLAGTHLSKQLVRSGTSVSLNYGEAQSGESRRDFIHKMKIVAKELRETFACLKIIKQAKLYKHKNRIDEALKECNELISIFVKSIATARKNLQQE